MDSARLDTLYSQCTVKLSDSYRKTVLLLDAGKTADASSEFKTSFVPEIKKFYSESAETPPRRYLVDCNWNEKIKNLYVLTQKTAGYLDKGDVKNSGDGLASIREFFYKLNADNKIFTAGGAVYAFRKEVDMISSKKSLLKGDVAALNSLKSKIFEVAASSPPKTGKEQFEADAKAWDEQASKLLSALPVDAVRIKKLKEITDGFYLKYGMNLE